MILYWENLHAHALHINDSASWHLYSEIDEHDDAVIKLELNGQVHELCWSNEYLQGREHLPLDPYHVIDFYSAVVKSIYELCKTSLPTYLNLNEIKERIIPAFWQDWKEHGLVTDNCW
jgi:hypothetical protein